MKKQGKIKRQREMDRFIDQINEFEEEQTSSQMQGLKTGAKKSYNKKRNQFVNSLREENYNKEEINKLINNGFTKEQAIDIIKYCGSEYKGIVEEDIIRAVFEINHKAHKYRGNNKRKEIEFYEKKISLLESIKKNTKWGTKPYNSYGFLKDKSGRDVIYFDLPKCGQVSFHIPKEDINKFRAYPKYKYRWKGVKDEKFPSYDSINNLHDLMMALGCVSEEMLKPNDGEGFEIYPRPINFNKLKFGEKCVAIFVDKETKKELKNEANSEKPIKRKKSKRRKLSRNKSLRKSKKTKDYDEEIQIKKVVFTKQEKVIEERFCKGKEAHVEIARRSEKYKNNNEKNKRKTKGVNK